MSTENPSDDFAPTRLQEQKKLRTIYDGNAAAPSAPPDGQGFYNLSTLTNEIDRSGEDLWTTRGEGQAALARTKAPFVDIAKRTQLPEALVTTIAKYHIANQLAEGRFVEDPDAAAVAEHKQTAEWNAESLAALRDTYGPKDGEQMLARVKKFARSHSGLARVLQARGLDSRPDVVKAFAEHVFSTGFR